MRLCRDRFVAFTYLDFGQIDLQKAKFFYQKLPIARKFHDPRFCLALFETVSCVDTEKLEAIDSIENVATDFNKIRITSVTI